MLCNWFQVCSVFTESPFLREISLEAEKKKEKTERQGNDLKNRLDSFLVCWWSLSGPWSFVITECVVLSEPAAF